MRTRFKIIAALAATVVLATAGCSGNRDNNDDDGSPELPDPETLLAAAADEMAGVETVRLLLTADTDVAGLPVRSADAVVNRDGEAQGTAEIDLGTVVEAQFVMTGDTFHYQVIGPWQRLPRAAAPYDPSAILDPDRGLANLLRNAQDAELAGQESVSGVDTYRITASFAADDVQVVLPGVSGTVPGTLWIGVETPLLHRADFEIPGGTVTADLSEFDEPVEIIEP